MARMPSVTGQATAVELGDPDAGTRLYAAVLAVSGIIHLLQGEYWEGALWAAAASSLALSPRSGRRRMSGRVRGGLLLMLAAGVVAVQASTAPAVRAAGIVLVAVAPQVVNIWLARQHTLPTP